MPVAIFKASSLSEGRKFHLSPSSYSVTQRETVSFFRGKSHGQESNNKKEQEKE